MSTLVLVGFCLAACTSGGTRTPSPTGVTSITRRSSAPAAGAPTVLVWSFGGYSATTTRVLLRALGHDATAVAVGSLPVASLTPTYPEIPVEAIAVDAGPFAAAMRSPSLSAALRSGVVVSQTESRLRHVRAGAPLRLVDGRVLNVTAVVPDAELGGYEAVVNRSRGVTVHITQTGYLLVGDVVSLTTLTDVVHRVLGSRAVRIRQAGVRPFLRAGDDVLPQAAVKARFGEFAIRRSSTGFRIDPAWVAAHIQTRQLPVLGRLTCNRAVLPDLEAVMNEIVARKLTRLIDVADFHRDGGCFDPRPLRGGAGELSRHAWGTAIDLNVATNPLGGPAHQDARLIRVFAAHGLTWGGRWLRPDPQHFEWVGDVPAYTEPN